MESAHPGKLWFSGKGSIYQDAVGPPFYDPGGFKWSVDLLEVRESIRAEVSRVIEDFTNFKPYFQRDIQEPYGSWSTLGILKWGVVDNKVLEKMPVLSSYLAEHKQVVGCFISKLDPGCEIHEHSGVTNANYRCHLGVKVPSSDPYLIGISVRDEKKAWGNGEVLIFLDADRHMVWNRSGEERYVLILDIIREDFLHRKDFILSRVIATMGFALFVELSRLKLLYRMPRRVLDVLGYLALPLFRLFKLFNRQQS